MNINNLAQGRWGTILPALGIPVEILNQRGHPCPHCNGHDRFAYFDRDGSGSYNCRGCGGGDGFSLLMKCHAWNFGHTAGEVRRVLGVESEIPPKQTKQPKQPKQTKPKTFKYALQLWEGADTRDSWVSRHPYARNKNIGRAAGAGRAPVTGSLVGHEADCLIIPSRGPDGDVIGVQAINGEGKKQSFGSIGELILGTDLDPFIPCCVFEGWASGVKWLDSRDGNGMAVVSFGKGRQRAVGESIEQRYPRHAVIVAVEVDS